MAMILYPIETDLTLIQGLESFSQRVPITTKWFTDGSFEINPFALHDDNIDTLVYVPSHPDASTQALWTQYVLKLISRTLDKHVSVFMPYIGFGRSRQMFQHILSDLPLEVNDSLHILDAHLDLEKFPVKYDLICHTPYDSFAEKLNKNSIIALPDSGSARRLASFIVKSGFKVMIGNKIRTTSDPSISFQSNEISENQTIWILDDVCDSGGTLIACAKALRDCGAKTVNAIVTHVYQRALNQRLMTWIDNVYYINLITNWGDPKTTPKNCYQLDYEFKLPEQTKAQALRLASSL